MFKNRGGSVLGFAMACSNTFGLVTGAFLLGFSLSEIPKSIWRNADWTTRQKVLSHKIAKMAVKLDDAHQELSNAIVVFVFSMFSLCVCVSSLSFLCEVSKEINLHVLIFCNLYLYN